MRGDLSNASDAELVAVANRGDEAAFAAIYDRYGDHIFDFSAYFLRDRDEAKDVAQDTFLIAWRRLDSLRDPDKLGSWLYSIARHESMRRATRRSRVTPSSEIDVVADPDDSPEAVAARREVAALVWEAADGLSDRDRAVLLLDTRAGLDGQELADALGVDRQHAYVLASNARERIDRSLGALLVAKPSSGECDVLEGLLAGWDGSFTPRLRKRVARHVDRCELCAAERRRRFSPAALLGTIPVLMAPDAVRAAVLSAKPAGLSALGERVSQSMTSTESGFAPAMSTGSFSTAKAVLAAGAVIVLGAIVGVVILIATNSPPPEDFATTSSVGSATTTTPDTTAPPESFCAVAKDFQNVVGSSGPSGTAPADFQAYFDTSLSYLDRLVVSAPSEIEPDVVKLREGFAKLAAGGDPAADSPELSAARVRFETYVAAVC